MKGGRRFLSTVILPEKCFFFYSYWTKKVIFDIIVCRKKIKIKEAFP
jgi:hypothetical protein